MRTDRAKDCGWTKQWRPPCWHNAAPSSQHKGGHYVSASVWLRLGSNRFWIWETLFGKLPLVFTLRRYLQGQANLANKPQFEQCLVPPVCSNALATAARHSRRIVACLLWQWRSGWGTSYTVSVLLSPPPLPPKYWHCAELHGGRGKGALGVKNTLHGRRYMYPFLFYFPLHPYLIKMFRTMYRFEVDLCMCQSRLCLCPTEETPIVR